ncbi:MAG: hypothetical protein ACK5XV_07485 [Flavobacteriales bacterium]|jgi:hypothetical protein
MKKHDNWDILLAIIAALYNLGAILFTLIWLFTNRFSQYKNSLTTITEFDINENITYSLFFAGVLGGAFYCLRSLYHNLARVYSPVVESEKENQQALNMKPWFFWYVYRPIQGGVLALILLALMNSQLITLQNLDADSLKSFYTLIALGFLCGLGSHEVIHKMQEVIKVVFAKAIDTSSNSEKKAKENGNS